MKHAKHEAWVLIRETRAAIGSSVPDAALPDAQQRQHDAARDGRPEDPRQVRSHGVVDEEVIGIGLVRHDVRHGLPVISMQKVTLRRSSKINSLRLSTFCKLLISFSSQLLLGALG